MKLPFEPSTPAQAAGIAALGDKEFLHRSLELNARGLRCLTEGFRGLGLTVVASQANFVMPVLDSEEEAGRIFEDLLSQGVMVRPLKAFGLPHCIRVSTGTDEDNELCIAAWRRSYGANVGAGRAGERDFLPLNGTDYVEFYVGNARQAAHFYRTAFGLRLTAYRGPETGTRDRACRAGAGQDPLGADDSARARGSFADHVRRHGDGVQDIALWVDDAESAFRETTGRGARSVREPETLRDGQGEVRISAIGIYGDTIHSFVERKNYRGAFLPGFEAVERRIRWRGRWG